MKNQLDRARRDAVEGDRDVLVIHRCVLRGDHSTARVQQLHRDGREAFTVADAGVAVLRVAEDRHRADDHRCLGGPGERRVLAVGVSAGLLAGYRRGWLDDLLSRLSDLVLAFPALVLYIIIVSKFGARMSPGEWLTALRHPNDGIKNLRVPTGERP